MVKYSKVFYCLIYILLKNQNLLLCLSIPFYKININTDYVSK